MAALLTDIANRTIRLAAQRGEPGVGWLDLCSTGATASTMKSLVARGYLRRREEDDGGKTWFITEAGQEVAGVVMA